VLVDGKVADDAGARLDDRARLSFVRAATDHPAITVAAVAALVAVPYLLAGPKLLADDFVWLRNAQVNGWQGAGGPRVDGRPGGAIMAALTFGLIGAHPLLLAIVQTVLRSACAVALRRCFAQFVSGPVALAAALVWVVVPDHLSLEMWGSTIAAPVALGLLAAGIAELARAWRATDVSNRHLLGAYLLLAGGVAVYELTAGVAGLAVLLVPFVVGRRPTIARVLSGWAIIGVPMAWAALKVSVYDTANSGSLDIRLVLPSQLSMGLSPPGMQGKLMALAGTAIVIFSLARLASPSLRSRAGTGERMVAAGALVIAAGVAPLVHLATNFQGLDDRLSTVSSVGAALVWTGGALVAAQLVGRRRATTVYFALAVALVVVVLPLRFVRTRDFVDAGRQATATTRVLSDQARNHQLVTVDGPIAVVDHYSGLNDGWNATAAVQLALHDPTVVIHVTIQGIQSGPPADDPLAAY